MPTLNIDLLQLSAIQNNQRESLKLGLEACKKAANMGADIVLFSEMWNTGYASYNPEIPGDHEKWVNQAITKENDFIKKFQALAKELNIAIVITYLEAFNNKPKNTASLIDRHGNIVLTYSKVHTCDFDIRETSVTPGKNFYVCNLDTSKGSIKTGIMICFDREFPESARILMLKGAEIILVPNSCFLQKCNILGDARIQQFRTRAFENMTATAMANYAPPTCDGHSCAFGADGKQILQAGEKKDIYLVQFDLEKLRKFRKEEVWGNAFRKPHRYKDLISLKCEKPFIRKNAFGKLFKREER